MPSKSGVWSGDLRIVVGLVGKVQVFLRVAFEDVVSGLEKRLVLDPFPSHHVNSWYTFQNPKISKKDKRNFKRHFV
jgi:hypothetical protein